MKQSSKTTVKNDKMKIVLIKSYQHLKLYFIFCILYVLINFIVFQIIFVTKVSFYQPHFTNASSIIVIRRFEALPFMCTVDL